MATLTSRSNVGARPGHKLGEIYAKTLYKRDEQGNIIINKENGLPMTTTDADERLAKPIGNIQPNLLMSVSPSFTYKAFTCRHVRTNLALDVRIRLSSHVSFD